MNALIVLGSNASDRTARLDAALRALDGLDGVDVTEVGGRYESRAVGVPAGAPGYMNQALCLTSTLERVALKSALRGVEASLGRVRDGQRRAICPIDIDLVAIADDDGRVTWLDPDVSGEPYTVIPAADVAGAWRHPGLGGTLGALATRMRDETPEFLARVAG